MPATIPNNIENDRRSDRRSVSRAIAEKVFADGVIPKITAEEYIVRDMQRPALAIKLDILSELTGQDVRAQIFARAVAIGQYVSTNFNIFPNIGDDETDGPTWRMSDNGEIYSGSYRRHYTSRDNYTEYFATYSDGQYHRDDRTRAGEFNISFQAMYPKRDFGLIDSDGFFNFDLPSEIAGTISVQEGHEMPSLEAVRFIQHYGKGDRVFHIMCELIQCVGSHDYYHAIGRDDLSDAITAAERKYFDTLDRTKQRHPSISENMNYEALGFWLNAQIEIEMANKPEAQHLIERRIHLVDEFHGIMQDLRADIERGVIPPEFDGVPSENIIKHMEAMLVRHLARSPTLFLEVHDRFSPEVVSYVLENSPVTRSTLEICGLSYKNGKIDGKPELPKVQFGHGFLGRTKDILPSEAVGKLIGANQGITLANTKGYVRAQQDVANTGVTPPEGILVADTDNSIIPEQKGKDLAG
jgi:hypothetical protein